MTKGVAPEEIHELDFRFMLSFGGTFTFVQHGLALADLARNLNDGELGSAFYILELSYPLFLEEVAKYPNRFSARYGVEHMVVDGRYLYFDRKTLEQFFAATEDDNELDCVIVGFEEQVSSRDLGLYSNGTANRKLGLSGYPDAVSFVHIHDNHFLYLEGRSLETLRKMISGAFIWFFDQIRNHTYKCLPNALIDLCLSEFHTASIICDPVEWNDDKVSLKDVTVSGETVVAHIKTGESYWTTGNEQNILQKSLGRELWITYDFSSDRWYFSGSLT